MTQRARAASALIFLLVIPTVTPLHAQVITGMLVCTVKDGTGAVLPGAAVTLTSPAQIGGPVEVNTNEKGQYRFPELAPGVYAIEVRMSGFAAYREEGLRILVPIQHQFIGVGIHGQSGQVLQGRLIITVWQFLP